LVRIHFDRRDIKLTQPNSSTATARTKEEHNIVQLAYKNNITYNIIRNRAKKQDRERDVAKASHGPVGDQLWRVTSRVPAKLQRQTVLRVRWRATLSSMWQRRRRNTVSRPQKNSIQF